MILPLYLMETRPSHLSSVSTWPKHTANIVFRWMLMASNFSLNYWNPKSGTKKWSDLHYWKHDFGSIFNICEQNMEVDEQSPIFPHQLNLQSFTNMYSPDLILQMYNFSWHRWIFHNINGYVWNTTLFWWSIYFFT